MKTIQDWIQFLEVQNYTSQVILTPENAQNLLKILHEQLLQNQLLKEELARRCI